MQQSVCLIMARLTTFASSDPALANAIPDDPDKWDIYTARTSGFWVIKTENREKDIIIKLTGEEREQMMREGWESDEKCLALVLLKEIKVIAELIKTKEKEKEREFWQKEETKREKYIEMEKNGVTIDLSEEDVDDYDY